MGKSWVFFSGPGILINHMNPEWLRVLMVDEEESDRALFGLAVERGDLEMWVATVGSAEEAVEYLEGRGRYGNRELHPMPEVIVMGLVFVGMKALEFLEWRRGSAVARTIPVVVFTDWLGEGEVGRAVELGAYDYVPKPGGAGGWQAAVKRIWAFGMEQRGRGQR